MESDGMGREKQAYLVRNAAHDMAGSQAASTR